MAEGTMTEKEFLTFLKAIRKGRKKKRVFRFHIYGTIDQRPEDYSVIEETMQAIQQYGSAEVLYVEVVDDENG